MNSFSLNLFGQNNLEGDIMKITYPTYYEKFICLADKCPDSCCKGWDIVIDDITNDYYKTVNGDIGAKLKAVTKIDDDGDTIFELSNEKCPFWNSKKLCDIYTLLGKEHLCHTCKQFPRLEFDYGDFVEKTLSLSCPEAARLILSDTEHTFIQTQDNFNGKAEYNTNIKDFLLTARKRVFDILVSDKFKFNYKLRQALTYLREVQNLINDEYYEIEALNEVYVEDYFDLCTNADNSFIFDLHKSFDIMRLSNKHFIKNISNFDDCITLPKETELEFTNLALYYIFRYFLNDINYPDVLIGIKKFVCAYVVIKRAFEYLYKRYGSIPFNGRLNVFEQYSKEVEQSYENQDLLEKTINSSENFSYDNLINLI